MTSRRSKIEIIHDMLHAIQEKNGRIKPTHLLYKSNLSHQKMKQSLEELVEKNLVREEEGKHGAYIVITDEGLKFLAEFKRIKELTDAFGLS
jgi:predicted transcriptional regulator